MAEFDALLAIIKNNTDQVSGLRNEVSGLRDAVNGMKLELKAMELTDAKLLQKARQKDTVIGTGIGGTLFGIMIAAYEYLKNH